MKTNKSMLCVFGFMLLFTAVAATAADAPKRTFKFKPVEIPGAPDTVVNGVNNEGALVGQYKDSSGGLHGYILNGKKLIPLDDPKGSDTECLAINSLNVIVGYYLNSSKHPQGFIYYPKTEMFSDIGPSGSLYSYASGINDNGVVTGTYQDSTGPEHGFLWNGTTYQQLDYPGASWTWAFGINNKGLITVIWDDPAGNVESSLYNSKTKKYIGLINVPGAVNTYAHAVDSAGDVVYTWQASATGPYHGELCTNCAHKSRQYYEFNDSKGNQTLGEGINDHELVCGDYETATSRIEGFTATY
jgi:probable HAF family extracellular repeat protein